MVTPETKKRLKEKADENGLSLTGFLEKVANEPIVFMDQNVKNLAQLFGKD